MSDGFDLFLARELAPDRRLPDWTFVSRVQARIALEERLAAQQRSLVASLARQMLAVLAVAASVLLIGGAAPMIRWFAESPATGLAVLLTGFVLLGVVLAPSASSATVSLFPRPGFSMP